ncbi:MAG: DUF1761 domain-containing protein [Chitinophagales bacterium]|nr:DUF1761 domain-containing protein [Chitinophagales bacterium]
MVINWLSVVLAAFSTLVVGFIWYGLLFKNAWIQASGVTEEKMKQAPHPAIIYGITFVLALIIAVGLQKQIIGLHLFIDKMKGGNGIISEQPFFHGAWHAFQSAFFYGLIPALVINALFDIRNWKYILINVGYWLVAVSIMGGIIGIMG